MQTFEWFAWFFTLLQLPILGGTLAVLARSHFFGWSLFLRNTAARHRIRSARFFECAAYPRLVGWLRYNVQGLAFCGLFLLYDVDLVFFFSEAVNLEVWTWGHALLLMVYVGFFVGGVYYDAWRYGLMWTY